MYLTFSVIDFETILKEKKIIVYLNKNVDKNKLETDTVIELYERASKTPLDFDVEIEDTNLIIKMRDYPIINSDYILSIKNLYAVDETTLSSTYKRRFQFKSSVLSTIEVKSPSMFEKIKKLIVEIQENNEDETKLLNSYYLEIATDNAFYNTVVKSMVNKNTVEIALNNYDQYYLRVRAQESLDADEFGLWSEIITFIYGKENESGEIIIDTGDDDPDISVIEPEDPKEDDDDIEIDDKEFELISTIEQGITVPFLSLEFNKKLLEYDNSNILIKKDLGLKKSYVNCETKTIDNILTITPIEGFVDNAIYTLKILNIQSESNDVLSLNIKYCTAMSPMYSDLTAVKSVASDIDVDDATILFHIREASRYVDYVFKNMGFEPLKEDEEIPFEVSQFVKYKSAYESLLNFSVQSSTSSGLSGAVGEVSFSEKEGGTIEVSSILKALKDEIDKWLDALKGFHLEGRATMKSAVKSGFYDFSSGHYLAFNRGITHTRGVDDPYE